MWSILEIEVVVEIICVYLCAYIMHWIICYTALSYVLKYVSCINKSINEKNEFNNLNNSWWRLFSKLQTVQVNLHLIHMRAMKNLSVWPNSQNHTKQWNLFWKSFLIGQKTFHHILIYGKVIIFLHLGSFKNGLD